MSQNPPAPDAAHGQALPSGTHLEEFVVERVLGVGGFGITYLAQDSSLGRRVVIKENLPAQFCWRDTHALSVRPRHTQGEDAENFSYSLESFRKEAATLASLDHPGIVKVLRSFQAHGTAYFVMPFVEGTALDEVIRERTGMSKPFVEEEIKDLLAKVLDALGYLHERGIYHRDIKPGNILMTKVGPVLIDFGAARQRLSERSLTVIESAGYTPFEQLQSRGKVGPWSDLYALGGTLYKTITGETPAKATDRAFDDPVVPLTQREELRGRYSPELLASIDMAMEPKASDRFQEAGQWLEQLVPTVPGTTQQTPTTRGPVSAQRSGERPTSFQIPELPTASDLTNTPQHQVPRAVHSAPKQDACDENEERFGLGRKSSSRVNRGAYLIIGITLSAVSCHFSNGAFIAPLLGGSIMGLLGIVQASTPVLFIFVWSAWVLATRERLKNIGAKPWVSAILLLPYISMFALFYCLALPADFKSHRKLDTAAYSVIALFVIILLLVIGLLKSP